MLPTFVLVEYTYQAVVFTVSFCLHLSLFWKITTTQLRKQLNLNLLLINIVLWNFTALACATYAYYMISAESASDMFYGPYIFWMNLAFRSISTCTSCSVCCLIFERIGVFIWPFSLTRIQRRLIFVSIITCTIILSYFLLAVPLIDTIPTTYSKCITLACLLTVFPDAAMTTPKMVASILTVILAFVFLYKLSKHQQQAGISRRNFRRANLISVFACVSELTLNALPFLIGTTLSYNKIVLTNVLGPYHLVCTATDSLLTAVIYRVIITAKLSSSSTSVGSNTNVRVISVVTSQQSLIPV